MNPVWRNPARTGATLLCVWLLAGCAGLGDRSAPKDVQLLTEAPVEGCENAGSVHVSVVDRLAGLQAQEGAVQRELVALARQSALQLGGNAIAALTGIDNGSQSFAVYRCP